MNEKMSSVEINLVGVSYLGCMNSPNYNYNINHCFQPHYLGASNIALDPAHPITL